jgi:hypothetical protein
MNRLGYTRYVAQGGDWGAGVVAAMGRQAPMGLLGIHTNFPAVITAEVGAALGGDKSALAALSEKELSAVKDLGAYVGNGGLSYLVMMGARPQAVGYGLTDSPAGLAGWMLVHSGFAKWSYGVDPKQSPTRDDVLDNFSLYWLTNTAASSARSTGRIAEETWSVQAIRRVPRSRCPSPSLCSRTKSCGLRRLGPAAPSPS